MSARRAPAGALAVVIVVAAACTPAHHPAQSSGRGNASAAPLPATAPPATGLGTSAASATSPAAAVIDAVSGQPVPVNPAIVAENAKAGTSGWRTPGDLHGHIEGYADTTSAKQGDTVTLRVSTPAPTWDVTA